MISARSTFLTYLIMLAMSDPERQAMTTSIQGAIAESRAPLEGGSDMTKFTPHSSIWQANQSGEFRSHGWLARLSVRGLRTMPIGTNPMVMARHESPNQSPQREYKLVRSSSGTVTDKTSSTSLGSVARI